jgi:dihydropteroate synthase
MGVLNVTPDSFSDGGRHFDPEAALQHALKMLEEGADIIDIGGESTRPGAKTGDSAAAKPAVSEKEELDRVVPVIKALKKKQPECMISVDTYKAAVARAAFDAGAEIVNDVSGFRWDANMKKTLAELKCGAVLMHSRGRPEEWAKLKPVPDVVTLVKRELREWADAAQISGMKRDHIMLDPGFGFGKRLEENYPLLKRFDELHQLRYPLMVGVSRKSFIGRAIARNGTDAPLAERLHGTVAAETAAILKGTHVVRTHDVRACVEAAKLADLVLI